MKHSSSTCFRNNESCWNEGYTSILLSLQAFPQVVLDWSFRAILNYQPKHHIFLRESWLCLRPLVTHPWNEHNRSSSFDCLTCRQWRPSFTQVEFHATNPSNPCFSCTNSLSQQCHGKACFPISVHAHSLCGKLMQGTLSCHKDYFKKSAQLSFFSFFFF